MIVRRWTTGSAVAAAVAATATLALAGGSDATRPGGAAPTPLYPDVVEAVPDHLQIPNTHQREWLRFATVHINIGEGNLQIRGGGQVAPCTIDGISYDQCTVATQELLDASGRIVATNPAGVALFHPEHNHWLEGSNGEGNNFTWLKFRLNRNGANPSITELDHSPCVHPAQCGTGGNP